MVRQAQVPYAYFDVTHSSIHSSIRLFYISSSKNHVRHLTKLKAKTLFLCDRQYRYCVEGEEGMKGKEEREARVTDRPWEKGRTVQALSSKGASTKQTTPSTSLWLCPAKASSEQLSIGELGRAPLPGRVHQGCTGTHGGWFSSPDGNRTPAGSLQGPVWT